MNCYFLLLAVIIHSQKLILKLLRYIPVLLSIDSENIFFYVENEKIESYLNTYKVLTVDQNDL